MNNNAFGGYDKPNFQPKNLTSDMWAPISAVNNYTAYTPEKPIEKQPQDNIDTSARTRRSVQERVKTQPVKSVVDKNKTKSQAVKSKKKKSLQFNKRPAPKAKEKTAEKPDNRMYDKTISSGNVKKQTKATKSKPTSKRQQSKAEKRREQANIAFVRLVKSGKTHDEARMIINRRKIRAKRIKTLGTVGLFTLFAVCFLLSYSYFRGGEIKEIIFEGDEVYTREEILEAGNISTGLNMLTVRENKLNDDVTKILPFISKIDVDYRLPDVLALNVVSTKEQLILKCDRKYICVDSTGKVVADKKKKLAEGQFLVQGLADQEYTVGEEFVVSEENAERFRIAQEFAKAAENAETLNYGVLDLKDISDIKFTYRSKIRLYLGDSSNLETKIERANGIMNSSDVGEKTGYINLKYDIGAYFMEGTME